MNNNSVREDSIKEKSYISNPGIAFSFDDSYLVDNWYKYGKEMFGYYDVKVTLNINAYHHFEDQREHTQKEIDKLIDLQSNGHEIAHHSLKHQSALKYTNEHGLKNWIDNEIIPLFTWIEKQSHSITHEKFKKPTCFAFPYSEYTEDHINELVPNYFKIVRGKLDYNKLPFANHTGFAPSIYIDSLYLTKAKNIKRLLKLAKKGGFCLIMMCHALLPKDKNWDDFGWGTESNDSARWRVTPETVKGIIDIARKMKLNFYTTSEIAGIAKFLDRNFENYLRNFIGISYDWIRIQDLSNIRELDLSYQNIESIDGIEYFINLEKLNIRGNKIKDLRLLNKLPHLQKVIYD
jgi:peptidoglycan/xylan/chitin deacetylase (PgdA/CDA1 family)